MNRTCTLVVALGMLDEGNPVSVRRDPQAGQVAARLVEHLSDRIFDAVTPLDRMDRGQLLAVR